MKPKLNYTIRHTRAMPARFILNTLKPEGLVVVERQCSGIGSTQIVVPLLYLYAVAKVWVSGFRC